MHLSTFPFKKNKNKQPVKPEVNYCPPTCFNSWRKQMQNYTVNYRLQLSLFTFETSDDV